MTIAIKIPMPRIVIMTKNTVDLKFIEEDNCKMHVDVCRYIFVCNLSLDISGCDMQID